MYIEIIGHNDQKSWVYNLINLYISSREKIEKVEVGDDEGIPISYYIYVIENGWRSKDLPANNGYYYIPETEAQRVCLDESIKDKNGKILPVILREKIVNVLGGLHLVDTIDNTIG